MYPPSTFLRELIPRQYVEAIIRIGVLQYERINPPLPLATCLARVLDNYVLPHGVQSNTEEFRAELASEELRAVFQRHRIALQRIFAYYAAHGVRRNCCC